FWQGGREKSCCISCCLNWKKPSFLEKNSPFSEDIFPRKTTKNGLKPGNPGNKPFSDWQGQKDLNPRAIVQTPHKTYAFFSSCCLSCCMTSEKCSTTISWVVLRFSARVCS